MDLFSLLIKRFNSGFSGMLGSAYAFSTMVFDMITTRSKVGCKTFSRFLILNKQRHSLDVLKLQFEQRLTLLTETKRQFWSIYLQYLSQSNPTWVTMISFQRHIYFI